MRTLLLVVVLCLPIASAEDDQLHTELAFDAAWSRYLLAKVGCPIPDHVIRYFTKDDCVLTPVIDEEAFARARRAAMRVFDLQEKGRHGE